MMFLYLHAVTPSVFEHFKFVNAILEDMKLNSIHLKKGQHLHVSNRKYATVSREFYKILFFRASGHDYFIFFVLLSRILNRKYFNYLKYPNYSNFQSKMILIIKVFLSI